jgi:hypothetical protein
MIFKEFMIPSLHHHRPLLHDVQGAHAFFSTTPQNPSLIDEEFQEIIAPFTVAIQTQ